MNSDFYKKGVDLKLLLILYWKRIWISFIWALSGAVIFSGAYLLAHVVFAPAREYEGVSKLYLTFNRNDDGDAYQYYNGYTWNDLMGTEPIMDKIMVELKDKEGFTDFTEEDVRKSITADILSDIRLLTITVRTRDNAKSNDILRACEHSLISFGEEMEEFEKIEVIDHGYARLVILENDTIRVTAAGIVIGFILSLVYIAISLVMDDHIYVPLDVERYLGYPVIGIIYRKEPQKEIDRIKRNLESLNCGSFEYVIAGISADIKEDPEETGGIGRIVSTKNVKNNSDVILAVPYSYSTVRLMKRDISDILLRGCRIKGAIITGADDKLYKQYYFGNRKSGKLDS